MYRSALWPLWLSEVLVLLLMRLRRPRASAKPRAPDEIVFIFNACRERPSRRRPTSFWLRRVRMGRGTRMVQHMGPHCQKSVCVCLCGERVILRGTPS